MNNRKEKPAWWVLYGIVAFMIGLLLLQGVATLPSLEHEGLELAIVLVSFISIGLWVYANEGALLQREANEYRDMTLYITEYPPTGEVQLDEPTGPARAGRRVTIRRRYARLPKQSGGYELQMENDETQERRN